MLGSEAWFGGFWNRSGGHINPLALSRGLARVVLDRGGRICAGSPALGVERRNDRWIVRTEKAEISGRVLIMATNAYTAAFSKSLMPAIAHEVMPVLSWQMATQPLSDTVRLTVIPGRQAMSDTHGELYFARYDARNRLVTGGAVIGPGNKPERLKAIVAERLQRLWPQIGSGATPMAGPAATVARSRLRSRSAMNCPRPCGVLRRRTLHCRSRNPCRSSPTDCGAGSNR
jgi:glycine/D-amino acid oxidase-like deaminating enzyme